MSRTRGRTNQPDVTVDTLIALYEQLQVTYDQPPGRHNPQGLLDEVDVVRVAYRALSLYRLYEEVLAGLVRSSRQAARRLEEERAGGKRRQPAQRLSRVLDVNGLRKVPVPRDGDCLFHAALHCLFHAVEESGGRAFISKHIKDLGLNMKKSPLDNVLILRMHMVEEWLSRPDYYSLEERCGGGVDVKSMAEEFTHYGVYTGSLGDAMPLGIANVLRLPLLILTSIENWPIISVYPRLLLPGAAPLVVAYTQTGSGHYDATEGISVDPVHGDLECFGDASGSGLCRRSTVNKSDRSEPQQKDDPGNSALGFIDMIRSLYSGPPRNTKPEPQKHVTFNEPKSDIDDDTTVDHGQPNRKRPLAAVSDVVNSVSKKIKTGDDLAQLPEDIDPLMLPDEENFGWTAMEDVLFLCALEHMQNISSAMCASRDLMQLYNAAVNLIQSSCAVTSDHLDTKTLNQVRHKRRQHDVTPQLYEHFLSVAR